MPSKRRNKTTRAVMMRLVQSAPFETCPGDGGACEAGGTFVPIDSPLGFKWKPHFHTAHSGVRVELFCITLEERRCFRIVSVLIAGVGKPSRDSVTRLVELGNMSAMVKHGIVHGWEARHSEITRNACETGDFDAGQIFDVCAIGGLPANTVSGAADLPGNFADAGNKDLPLSGKVLHGFADVEFAQTGDEQSFSVFQARRLEFCSG